VVSRDLVVGALRSVDYWKVIDYWRLFDKNGSGAMDRVEFVNLLNGMNVGADALTQTMCSELFDLVDMDGSGETSVEEFLGWVFALHRAYCGGVRSRLGRMDPDQVKEYFQKVDANGSGSLDRAEFATFIKKFSPDSGLARTEINELFSVIDVDHSGEIEAPEFLAWVYPREDAPLARTASKQHLSASTACPGRAGQGRMQRERSLPALHGAVGGGSCSSSLPEGTAPRLAGPQPVALEFTIGADFRPIAAELKRALKDAFGNAVRVWIIEEPAEMGCRRLVVQVGRGVVLWDRSSMVMHRDDPFASLESSRDFLAEKMQSHLPTLLRAMQLSRRRDP